MLYAIIFILVLWIIFLHIKLSDFEKSLKDINTRIDWLAKKIHLLNKEKNEAATNNIIKEEQSQTLQQDVIQEEETTVANNDVSASSINEINEQVEIKEETIHKEFKCTIIEQKQDNSSFESIFLGNIFNIIGAVAIIVGCGIFIKLISPFIIFTPLLKTLIGLIAGTLMVTVGSCNKKENLKTYTEVLIGTGFAVLFITIYCTTVLFHTFPLALCISLGILILLASYYMADKQKTVSMIAIALLGGYLNVFIVSSVSGVTSMFSYLIFLNILSIIFVYRNPDKSSINVLNLLATYIIMSCTQFNDQAGRLTIACPVILWLIYLVSDYVMRMKSPLTYDKKGILNWINLGVLIAFASAIYSESRMNIALLLIVSSIIYNIIICLIVFKESNEYKPYVNAMLTAILFTVFYISTDITRIALWSLIAVIVAVFVVKFKREYLSKWILVFAGVAFTNLFFIDGVCYTKDFTSYVPLFNKRLLAFMFPVIASGVSYLLIKKSEDKSVQNSAQILKFGFVSLLYLFVVFELNDFMNSRVNKAKASFLFVKHMLYSIIGFIYALQMKKYATETKSILFDVSGYLVGFVALLILLFTGANYEPIKHFIPVFNFRFLAFLSAIGTAYLFAKWTKSGIYNYLAVMLGFFLLTFETGDYIDKFDILDSYLISVIWLLYAGIITILGIFKDKKVLKNSGIWISIIAMLKIILHDMANVEMIYKLIVFLTLGVVFMIISYLYNANKKRG